ncbi:unnamed protein product [Lupinus luteus]|uniref:G-patch domain-containing protein n=1 Tax=Lupinus luteus TaxID=3873 RepID=A0AAV1WU52_LUPLU
MDVAGHSIEDCEQFKVAVRKLMACGKLEFEDEARPYISSNPIPNHNQSINAIIVNEMLVKRVSDLGASMQHLFFVLKGTGYDIEAPTTDMGNERSWDLDSHCDYHHGQAGHSIEDCWVFKARVQVLLNLGVIRAQKHEYDGEEVDVVEKVTLRVPLLNDPIPERVTLRVRKPQPFAYESDHTVPWNYEVKVEAAGERPQVVEDQQHKEKDHMHEVNQVVTRIMMKNGYEEGKGLGAHLQGAQSFVPVSEKFDKFGLGYEATSKCSGHANKQQGGVLQSHVPHITKSFLKSTRATSPENLIGPYIHLSINSLEEDDAPEASVIFVDEEDTPLKNWHSEPGKTDPECCTIRDLCSADSSSESQDSRFQSRSI